MTTKNIPKPEEAFILDSVSELIAYQDTNHIILWVNKAAADSVASTREQLIGRACYEIWHKRDKPCPGCPVDKSRLSGRSQEGEIISPDNREWLIRAYPIHDEKGKVSGLVEVTRDITERKKIEKSLERERSQLLAIFDSIDEVVYISDPETYEVLYVNQSVKNLLGDVVGKKCYKVFQNLDSPCEFCSNPHIFGPNLGKPYIWEFQNRILQRWYHCIDRAIQWPDGRWVRYEMAIDINERKQADKVLKKSLAKYQKAVEGAIEAVATITEMKDPYTAGHQKRVAKLACAVAKEMGLSEERVEAVRITGLLHDIGKIYVPAEILSKPSRLTEIEMSLVKNHPKAGAEILKSIEFPWPICRFIIQHHERMNGTGYPSRLTGENIFLEARILAVADVIEAMASHRPYRPAHTIEETLQEVTEYKGILFDPDVVEACLKLFQEKGFTFDQESEP